MPYSSSAFTSAASVKRGGGWVKCWSVWMRSSGMRSPGFIGGSLRPSSSSSAPLLSLPSSYTARKPGSMTVVPLARKLCSLPAARSTLTVFMRGRDHLAGDGALPDQFVELALVVGQVARHLRGRAQRARSGAPLRALPARSWTWSRRRSGLSGSAPVPKSRAITSRISATRIHRQADRVGTHVADQADRAFLADRHAFVQLLRDLHGLAGGEAELARAFLLQGRGGERRRRTALAFLAGHVGDVQRALRGLLDAQARGFGGVAFGDGELSRTSVRPAW